MTPEAKSKEFFKKLVVSNFSLQSGSKTFWRCRAKLAVRQEKGAIQIGLFQEGSHTISPVFGCTDHHPQINEAIELISNFLTEEKISGYNETSNTGEVRYLQCVVERKSSRIQLTLVINSSFGKVWVERVERLFKKKPSLWHSLWINVQQQKTNTIFGKEWHHVLGEKYLWESLCGYNVPFLPSHFGQANLEMFEQLLNDMLEIFPRDMDVAELFSGIGLISILLRPLSHSVTLYEIEPSAKDSFLLLQQQLPIESQSKCIFIVGDANRAHEVCEHATAVIVDPPRKGVSKEILDTIIHQKNIEHLLYISCSWKTFERDAEILLKGNFQVQFARAYLFFPGTDHLETMCLFSRNHFR